MFHTVAHTMMQGLASAAGTVPLTDAVRGNEDLVRLVWVVSFAAIGIMVAVTWAVVSTTRTREHEKTKREIAAYVAEGSISAEEGERLMSADMPGWARPQAWGCGTGKPKVSRVRFDKSNGTVEVTRG